MDISFFLIPVSSQISLIAVFFLLAPFFNLPFGNSQRPFFLIKYSGSLKKKLTPEKKEGITKCKWFSLSELVITLKDSRPQTHYLLEFVLNDPSYKNYIKTKKNK